MSKLLQDVKNLTEYFPRLELEGNIVHVKLEAEDVTWRVDVLFCDEDTYPCGEVVVMCDQDEDRAAMCTAELEDQRCKGLRGTLSIICKVFCIASPWGESKECANAGGYSSVDNSVQHAPSVGFEGLGERVPAQPSLLKAISGASGLSTESYEMLDGAGTDVDSTDLVPTAEPLTRSSSCTLRGLTMNLMEPPDIEVSAFASSNLRKDTECALDCAGSPIDGEGPKSCMSLEEKAMSVLLDKACEKLRSLAVKERPKKQTALVSLLQRAVARDGAKAFILRPIEVAEVLFNHGLLASEKSAVYDMLSACKPADEDMVSLSQCPETQARIVQQATRSKCFNMGPVEVAKWVLLQAYVRIPLSAARLADALVAAGVAVEGNDGKLTFELDAISKPPFHVKRLFMELQLPDETAAGWKKGNKAKQASSASQSQLDTLAAAFPDHCPVVLSAVLEEHDHDINRAVEALLDSLVNASSEAPLVDNSETRNISSSSANDSMMIASTDDPASSLIAKGLDAMAGALGNKVSVTELAREAEAVAALGQQLSFLDFHISYLEPREENATPDLLRELSMLRRSRAAVADEKVAAQAALTALRLLLLSGDSEKDATSGQVKVAVSVDVTRPSQSLRSHEQTVVSQIQQALHHSGPWAHYASYQFAAMLSREQELHKDFICFYHSYSYAALLYEVQAELARMICKLPDDFAPVPRVSMDPFNVCKSMNDLRDWAQKQGGNDHDPAYRGVGLSLSCSLFASGSEAPPMSCFQVGYSCTDLSFRKLLLDSLGGGKLAEHLADAVVDIGKRHGLPVYGYESKDGDSFYGDRGSQLTGYMLQIFVHRSIVEKYAYPSEPFGVPLPGGIIDYVEKGKAADGQARLYFCPKTMLNPRWARLFHYCARPSQSSLDPAVPSSRGSLIKELRTALAPLLGNGSALASTAARLGLDVVH